MSPEVLLETAGPEVHLAKKWNKGVGADESEAEEAELSVEECEG
jgi:hypothetical protein